MSNRTIVDVMKAAIAAGLSFVFPLKWFGVAISGWLTIEQQLLMRIKSAGAFASFAEAVSRVTAGKVAVAVSATGSSLHVCLIPAAEQVQLTLPGRAGQTVEEAMAWSCIAELGSAGTALLERVVTVHDAAIDLREQAEVSGGLPDVSIEEAQRAAQCSRSEIAGARGLIEFAQLCRAIHGDSSSLEHVLREDVLVRVETDGTALLLPIRVLHSDTKRFVATVSGFRSDRIIYVTAEKASIPVAVDPSAFDVRNIAGHAGKQQLDLRRYSDVAMAHSHDTRYELAACTRIQ